VIISISGVFKLPMARQTLWRELLSLHSHDCSELLVETQLKLLRSSASARNRLDTSRRLGAMLNLPQAYSQRRSHTAAGGR
jgi:hypothetical protein